MSRIENSLTRLEARLRAMIEGNASRDGIPRKLHRQLVRCLVEALAEIAQVQSGVDGIARLASKCPDQFTLLLPAGQAQLLLSHPAELDWLTRKLEITAADLNIHLDALPILQVVADPTAKELSVFPVYRDVKPDDSMTVELEQVGAIKDLLEEAKLPDAFLIVNGLTTYHLSQTVINIGSDPGNQLVLDQPGISQSHAQLRFTGGRYTIFDLDSREGTFVNGAVVSNRILAPGDVIRLGSVPLVYGEESAPPLGRTQQLPAEPPGPEVL